MTTNKCEIYRENIIQKKKREPDQNADIKGVFKKVYTHAPNKKRNAQQRMKRERERNGANEYQQQMVIAHQNKGYKHTHVYIQLVP